MYAYKSLHLENDNIRVANVIATIIEGEEN